MVIRKEGIRKRGREENRGEKMTSKREKGKEIMRRRKRKKGGKHREEEGK